MRFPKFSRLVLLAVAASLAGVAGGETLYYTNLVSRLTDLERLALLPPAGNTAAQWSSYDRASYYDSGTGQYVNWSANGDCCGFIRTEGSQQVLAEMQGPGCLWRIWSATPGNGRVRIYLDGAATPAVDLVFTGYFNGQNVPFNRPALVHTTAANGWNNYTPIPYQTSCKIVGDSDWGLYYHLTYETFSPGTMVPAFTQNLSPVDSAALDQANSILSNPGSDPAAPRAGQQVLSSFLTASGASTQTVAQISGPRAITALRVKLDTPLDPTNYHTLRELALRITWDGEPEAAVWCPLGDFFGTAPGENFYRSLPLGHTPDGWWYCYWYMPFNQAAHIELLNDGPESHQVQFEITHAPLSRPIAELGRFHAKWHRDAFLPAEPGRGIDWTLLKTTGRGRFVGTMLHVWDPRGGWWGEGDEKFFVDGEKFPSIFGTGSEDYFGYAWSSAILFQHAYHNQTHNDGNNRGHLSVNRWHLADSVPFQTGFEGCIEKYFANSRPTLYAGTAYWYLAPGGVDPYPPAPLSERVDYWPPIEIYRVPGALEGESLFVATITGGTAQVQDMSGFGGAKWSGEAQLWWTGGQPGNRLDLVLPVTNTGKYRLSLQLTKARDYGIIKLYLDGTALGSPIDLYDPNVVTTGAIDLGLFQLAAGPHTLRFEIVGANPSAIPAYMAGLDYVKLDPHFRLVDALLLGYPGKQVAVVYSVPVDPATATNRANYSFNHGGAISSIRMGVNPEVVLLTTSGLPPGTSNVLSVNGIKDLDPVPNTLAPNSTVLLEQRLHTWLRLDETGGDVAGDSSGNSRAGALVNGVAPGYVGKALGAFSFDGVNDHVRLQPGYADFTAGLTVALWTQVRQLNYWARFIDLGNGNNADNILFAGDADTDRITFEVYRGGGSGGKTTTPRGALRPNNWQHLAATLDPLGRAVIYLDGIPIATGTTAVPETVVRTNNFLGRSNWPGDAFFAGIMDDVRVYERPLEAAAVNALAREGNPTAPPSLSLTSTNGSILIHYEGRLMATPTLSPPDWQPIPDAIASPYLCPPANAQRFFRAQLTP